jgi:hypothetical protein
LNHIDSTNVRIFSYSQFNDSTANSRHKQLVRYIRLHQEEDINPLLQTPMNINIMIREDRVGRSGDHIPFREKGYRAVRFCSQNEHGDGSGTPPDRQHTSDDILGLDLTVPPDGVLDTFFVDMGYLRRNAITNGVNLGYLAIAPPQPQPEFNPLPDGVEITMTGNDTIFRYYRVGIRSKGSGTLYFDTVMTFTDTTHFVVEGLDPGKEYYFSVMNVENTVESIFSDEFEVITTGINDHLKKSWGLWIDRIFPNPSAGMINLSLNMDKTWKDHDAMIVLKNPEGLILQRIPLTLNQGSNLISLTPPVNSKGLILCTLSIDGIPIQTVKLVVM